MTGAGAGVLAVDVLVGVGLLIEVICCAGLLLGAGPLDRLHYASAAGTVGPILFAAAVGVARGWTGGTVLTLLTVGFVLVSGPVLTAAIARVAAIHEHERGEQVGASG